MANESRVFRLPAGMRTQVVANAVEAFRHPLRGWRYRVPKPQKACGAGPSGKRRLEAIAGMKMLPMQIFRMD